MKNIVVTVDDETYRLACEKAAKSGTSVSALLQSYLSKLASGKESDSEIRRLQRLQYDTLAAIEARGGGLRSRDNLQRAELYGIDAIS